MNFEKEFNVNFKSEKSNATSFCCKWISLRCRIAALSLLGCVVLVTTRSNLNLAIVSMTTQSADDNFTISNDSCYSYGQRNFIKNFNYENSILIQYENGENKKPEFDWSQTTQGIILGAYYIGYICFQTIGSRAAELFGAKWICGVGILLSGLINLSTPLIVRFNFYLFIASRILLGLSQSAIFSSFYALFVRWFPDDERPKFLSWLDTGNCIGGILVMIVSGYLIRMNLFGGWPSAFYVPGICALIWFAIWSLYVNSDPRQSRWISKDELNYIIENQTNENASKQRSICWSKIVKSKEFYSVLIAKFLISFTFEMLFAKLPTYLNNVISIPIEQVFIL